MKLIWSRILRFILLAACLGALAGRPHRALALENSCSWSPGPNDFYWNNGENWVCDEGEGPPDGDKDVTVSASQANAPMVTGSAAAKTLSLSGWLIIAPGGNLAVSGGWSNSGEAVMDSQGTITGDGQVKLGGTFHLLSSGTIAGNLSIDALATASVDVVYLLGDLTNDGHLVGEDVDAQFHMQGPLVTNYGQISVDEFLFQRGSGLVQQVTGSGSWDSGIGYLFVEGNTHLTALSNLTFGPQHFLIRDDNSLLDVGSHMVTFVAPAEVDGLSAILSTSGGTVHTQGEPVTILVPNEASFDLPLVVENGVTRASGVFSGTVTVEQEGTLRVIAPPSGSLTAHNLVTVNGVLDGDNLEAFFVMQGQQLSVNGLVSVPALYLQGAAHQDIAGNGSLDVHHLSVDAPGGVDLGVPASVDGWLALNANLVVASGKAVTLTESAVINGANDQTDLFGRVVRTGPFALHKAYGFGNHYLTVEFTAGSALPAEIRLDLKPDRCAGLAGSIRRCFAFQSSGGSGWAANLILDYRDAEISGKESYLQAWKRPAGNQPWVQVAYAEAHAVQNWVRLEGLTAFSEWGLALHSIYLPLVSSR